MLSRRAGAQLCWWCCATTSSTSPNHIINTIDSPLVNLLWVVVGPEIELSLDWGVTDWECMSVSWPLCLVVLPWHPACHNLLAWQQFILCWSAYCIDFAIWANLESTKELSINQYWDNLHVLSPHTIASAKSSSLLAEASSIASGSIPCSASVVNIVWHPDGIIGRIWAKEKVWHSLIGWGGGEGESLSWDGGWSWAGLPETGSPVEGLTQELHWHCRTSARPGDQKCWQAVGRQKRRIMQHGVLGPISRRNLETEFVTRVRMPEQWLGIHLGLQVWLGCPWWNLTFLIVIIVRGSHRIDLLFLHSHVKLSSWWLWVTWCLNVFNVLELLNTPTITLSSVQRTPWLRFIKFWLCKACQSQMQRMEMKVLPNAYSVSNWSWSSLAHFAGGRVAPAGASWELAVSLLLCLTGMVGNIEQWSWLKIRFSTVTYINWVHGAKKYIPCGKLMGCISELK